MQAHGTGTAVGDPIEMNAIGTVFGNAYGREADVIVGSIKASILFYLFYPVKRDSLLIFFTFYVFVLISCRHGTHGSSIRTRRHYQTFPNAKEWEDTTQHSLRRSKPQHSL